jgi:hypothetical protein
MTPLRLARLGAPLIAAFMLFACDRQPDAPTAAPETASPGAKAPKVNGYTMSVTNWEGPTGEEGYVVVTIEAKNGHKINKEYPHKVSLDAPPKGLDLPMRTMKRADAEADGDKRLVFSIPAVPNQAGEYALNGKVKLSVCNDDTCQMAKEKLAARVVAQ